MKQGSVLGWCQEARKMPLNKALVGKEYPPQPYAIKAEESKKYAYGYNEDLPLFFDESRPGGIVAPPMFGVKYAGVTIAQAFFDPDFQVNFARLVHGEQDMEFLEAVKPGDVITTIARIASAVEKSTGEIFVIETNSKNQTGQPVLRCLGTFFIRGKPSGSGSKEPEALPERTYRFTQDMKVREDQTYIYAEGSGDHNPIHVDPAFAKQVGLPGIILQGLCTMAFCFKTVQDQASRRDPLKIRRLRVRFAKPVLPLDTVTTRGWIEEKRPGLTVFGVDGVNQRGDTVIKNGLAHVAD